MVYQKGAFTPRIALILFFVLSFTFDRIVARNLVIWLTIIAGLLSILGGVVSFFPQKYPLLKDEMLITNLFTAYY